MARDACTCAGRAVHMEPFSTSLPRCPAAWGGVAAVRQAAGPRGEALRRAGSRRRRSESQDMAREACTCAGRAVHMEPFSTCSHDAVLQYGEINQLTLKMRK